MTDTISDDIIRFTVRHSIDSTIEITLPANATVWDLIYKLHEVWPQQQEVRLIFAGRLLADKNATLSHYGVGTGAVIHATVTTHQQSFKNRPMRLSHAEDGNDQDMTQALKSLTGNKQLMRQMMMNNPQVKQALKRNPEMRQAMESDDFVDMMTKASQNPQLMKEMMRNADRAMLNIENVPGFVLFGGFRGKRKREQSRGMAMLEAHVGTVRDPLDAAPPLPKSQTSSVVPSPRDQDVEINRYSLPNPWSRDPDAAYKAQWARQLRQLQEMGFTDDRVNLRVLKQYDGDLTRAIDEYYAYL